MSKSTQHTGTVIVVGVLGSIGHLIANRLAETQIVIGIDIVEPGPEVPLTNLDFRCDNIIEPSEATRTELAAAGTIILAVSFATIEMALPGLLRLIPAHCLIVDTLSIKTPFLKLLESYQVSQQALGINPMFSGDLNHYARPLAVVTYTQGEGVNQFLARVNTWELRVIALGVIEHDQVMAVLQSLGHALLITFGKVLVNTKLDMKLIQALAPPPFRVLLMLLARLTKNHPDVYWDIQANNPFAKQYRAASQVALDDLETSLCVEDQGSFAKDFHSLRARLFNQMPEYVELSKQVFEFIHQNTHQADLPLKELVDVHP